MNKRIISLLLSLIIALSAFIAAPAAFSAEDVDIAEEAAEQSELSEVGELPSAVITVGDESHSYHVGDTVRYTFYMNASDISANGKINGVEAAVHYDKSILKLVGDRDEICPNLTQPFISAENDVDYGVSFNAANIGRGFIFDSDDKVLVEICFEVIGSGSSAVSTEIKTLYRVNDSDVTVFIQNSQVVTAAPATSDEQVLVECPHPDDPVVPTDKAIITLYALDGECETKEFNVGDEFTVYTVLDSSANDNGRISTVQGEQYYTNELLRRMDMLDEDDNIADKDSVFPVMREKAFGSDRYEGVLFFNGANGSYTDPFVFDSDSSKLIVTRYKVTAPGVGEVSTRIKILALADDYLTRVINKYELQVGFSLNCYSSFKIDSGYNIISSFKLGYTDKLKLTLDYSYSDGDLAVQNASARIKVDNAEMLSGSFDVYLNNKKTTDYSYEDGVFDIPLGKAKTGCIVIVFSKSPDKKLITKAELILNTDKRSYMYFVASLNYSEFITLEAPERVGSDEIHVTGTTGPDREVTIYSDGIAVKTVKANKAGVYSADINLGASLTDHIYRVKAEYTDAYGKMHSAACNVEYIEGFPELVKFSMNYRGREYDLLNTDWLNITYILVRYGGNYPFEFRVKLKKPFDKKVYITSTRNGKTKYMACGEPNANGEYIANGFFEPDEKDYVPGTLEVVAADGVAQNKDGTITFENPMYLGKGNRINWYIDPSGYVYAGIDSSRVYDAEVTAYHIPYDPSTDDDSFWESPDESRRIKWDASEYSQENPILTTLDGNYAWDVPEGWWQLEVKKDGYVTAVTDWMTVLPPRLDVNIDLQTTMAPEIESAELSGSEIKLSFLHAMKPESLSGMTLKDSEGNNIAYELKYTPETGKDGRELAKTFTLKLDSAAEKKYIVECAGAENYSGIKGSVRAETTTAQGILGDLDKDGAVTIADATILQRFVVSLPTIDFNNAAADIDGDNNLTIVDTTFIQKYVVGMDTPYMIGEKIG